MTEEVVRMVREHGPDGNMINVERRVRIHRTEIQKPRVVAERRRWTKFGAAAGTAAGPEPGITIISEEPTFLEFRDFDLEKEQAAKPAEATATKSGKYVPPSRSTIEATALQRQQEAQNGPSDRPGAYVPPSMRNQGMGGGAGGYQQGEKYSLLLSNIPDDADEEGLKEICRSRGVLNCDRLNVVRTKTNPARAMKAYADFRTTEDRKKAQELLQGARYGFMILSAEIVNKDEGGGGARGFGGGGFGGGGRF